MSESKLAGCLASVVRELDLAGRGLGAAEARELAARLSDIRAARRGMRRALRVSSPAAPRRLAPMVSAPVTACATMPAAVPSAKAGSAPAAPGAQGAVMQRMLEA